MSEQQQMELEASRHFIMSDFVDLFEVDPKGVAQDLVDTYKRTTCSQLSNLIDHFLHLPKVERR